MAGSYGAASSDFLALCMSKLESKRSLTSPLSELGIASKDEYRFLLRLLESIMVHALVVPKSKGSKPETCIGDWEGLQCLEDIE